MTERPKAPWGGLVMTVAFLAVATIVLEYFGVGGYRGGFLITAAVLVVLGVLVAWRALVGVPQRSTWLVSVGVVALVLASVLVERAPWSTGRLSDAADGIDLPYHQLRSERTSGRPGCDPCPTLERRLAGPDLNTEAATIEVALAIMEAGYPLEITTEARRIGRILTGDDDLTIEARIVREDDGGTLLTLVFRSRR